jgi:hypothetical protein
MSVTMPSLILVLIDADTDCPKELAPPLLKAVVSSAGTENVAVVLPKVEYETWFVAAAESLGGYLLLDPEQPVPGQPEQAGCGKGWIEHRFRGAKYSETLDQPSMTAAMDLRLCRQRSPSFDKLCRELERYAR